MAAWQKVTLWFLAALLLASFSGAQVVRSGGALLQGQTGIIQMVWLGLNAAILAGAMVIALRILYRTARSSRVREEGRHE